MFALPLPPSPVRWLCRALRAQTHRLGAPNSHPLALRHGAVAVAGLAQEEGLQAWRRRQKVVIVTGPTAVGKTNVSIALAERLNGEVISADSVQVYKGLDIGSDKVWSTTVSCDCTLATTGATCVQSFCCLFHMPPVDL